MKLLFVLPYQVVKNEPGIRDKPTISLPLGVLGIASYLREAGWHGEVEIYDCRLTGKVTENERGDVHFGDLPDEVERRIKASKADVIGISNMFTWQVGQAYEVADIARRACPDSTIVMGGPHVSSHPEEALARDAIDFVVMGEGEERTLALLQALEAGERPQIEGVMADDHDKVFLRKSKKQPISFIQKLDELPFPAYDMVDVQRYFSLQRQGFSPREKEEGARTVSMITSRGCPHKCVFCSIQNTMGYKWRWHSVDYIERHLSMLQREYGVDYVHFEDDNFTHDPERYDEILESLVKFRPLIRWDTPNGIRGDTWTFERVKRSKEAGCQYLIVAIESGVQRVIDNVVKKNLDLSQVDDLMDACKRNDLPLFAFYILGLPGETLAEVQANADYALERFWKYDCFPTFNLAIPMPGTELHDNVTEHQLYDGRELQYRANVITTEEWSPEDIKAVYDRSLLRLMGMMAAKSATSPKHLKYLTKLTWRYRHYLGNFTKSALESITGNLPGRLRALAG